MNLYDRFLLPGLLARSMSRPLFHEPRRRVLASASGRILELGFGAGANLPHYPREVTEIETIEPNRRLAGRAPVPVEGSPVKVTVHEGQAEKLPFPDRSFDTIVSTFTLCSVEDPGMVLSEVRRTLRASGQFLFLEHGLSPAPEVARWQRRLGPLQRRLVGGCHLTRDINEILAAAGFESVDRSSFYVAGISRAVGYMTAGRALAP